YQAVPDRGRLGVQRGDQARRREPYGPRVGGDSRGNGRLTRQEAAPVRRSTAENITGIVDSPREARQAETCLTDEGFARDAITIMSAEPLPEFISEFGSKSPGRAGMLSIAGGIAGAAAAIALTVWTSGRMGLITGGMPIITPWAFGIIVYELIAL